MTFAREAWPFVLPFVVLSLVLAGLGQLGWCFGSLLLGLLVLLFFRNPRRSFSGDDSHVLSAADGKVLRVETVELPELGPGAYQRVATFLSVFDVHVQKAPVSGKVLLSKPRPGEKRPAWDPNAGDINEQHLAVFERADGDRVAVLQIVGLVARRVVCYLRAGDQIDRGQLMGVIKFGSRVDVFVPASYEVLVQAGDRVRTGATPIARKAR
ncbi:MAG TPA: phosphatidylserine decarboxylase [Thermoanaerobaculia bacterium]|nr:phosphatidylserine decarboxylase [Thermoanaerobaculia bacterium]